MVYPSRAVQVQGITELNEQTVVPRRLAQSGRALGPPARAGRCSSSGTGSHVSPGYRSEGRTSAAAGPRGTGEARLSRDPRVGARGLEPPTSAV